MRPSMLSRMTSLNRVYWRVDPGSGTTLVGAPGLVNEKDILSDPK